MYIYIFLKQTVMAHRVLKPPCHFRTCRPCVPEGPSFPEGPSSPFRDGQVETIRLTDHTRIPVFVIQPIKKALKVPSLPDIQEFPHTPDLLLNPGRDNKEQVSHVLSSSNMNCCKTFACKLGKNYYLILIPLTLSPASPVCPLSPGGPRTPYGC